MGGLWSPAQPAAAHKRAVAAAGRRCACAVFATMVLACGSGVGPGGRRAASAQDPATTGVRIVVTQAVGRGGQAQAAIYDRRWLELEAGEVTVTLGQLSHATDVLWLAAEPALTWLEHQLEPALEPGLRVAVVTASDAVTGTLLGVTGDTIVVAPDQAPGVARWLRRAAVRSLRPLTGAGTSVRARVRVAERGRHLVELAYRAAGISWRMTYYVDVAVDQAGAATIERLAGLVAIDGLGTARTRRVLFELWSPPGHPWSAAPVWRGDIDTAGYQSSGRMLPIRVMENLIRGHVPARIEHVYSGAVPVSPTASVEERAAAEAGRDSHPMLTRELVIPGEVTRALAPFPAGVAKVRVISHEGAVEELEAQVTGSAPGEELRMILGPSETVTGDRIQRWVERQGNRIRERYEVVLASRAAVPVTVRVLEPLIRPGQVTMIYADPSPVTLRSSELELLVTVPPGEQATAAYELEYAW